MLSAPHPPTVFSAACSEGQAASDSRPNSHGQQLSVAEQPKVALAGRVNDAADIIGAERGAVLSRRLEELEQSTRHQMLIVTVQTWGGQDIADFTRELANAWGIGRAEHDDGVVLLVAPNERKVRIAVGYGLEKSLPDPLCQTNDQHILPRF